MYYTPKSQDMPGSRASAPQARETPNGTRPPVRLLARRLIGDNEVFQVYFDHLRQPDGREVVDYLSIVPKVTFEGSIGGVAILPECGGKIGLIRVYRHPLGRYAWEVPRGFVSPGELPAQSALRELREEAGLAASPANLQPLGTLAPEPGVLAAKVSLFAATHCSPAGSHDSNELGHTGLRFFSLGEIADLIAQEEIQDPCTMVAYFSYLKHTSDAQKGR